MGSAKTMVFSRELAGETSREPGRFVLVILYWMDRMALREMAQPQPPRRDDAGGPEWGDYGSRMSSTRPTLGARTTCVFPEGHRTSTESTAAAAPSPKYRGWRL